MTHVGFIGRGARALLALALSAVMLTPGACGRAAPSPPPPASGELPGLAQIEDREERDAVVEVVGLIRAGGPFRYPDKDGSVFGNFERRLPDAPRGTYHEYTVPTPGVAHRGARRIIAGREPDLWYTRDHYATFIRLTP
ncbi:MAG: ribonuclease domain-containing protein [Myxococcota bacterium]